MAVIRIDQRPADVPLLLNRGDDMTPFAATFKALNLSTVAGYTWSAHIMATGALVKTLTVTAVLVGADTVVTVSGLTSAESTALATTGLTWDLMTTAPLRRTYFDGGVTCD